MYDETACRHYNARLGLILFTLYLSCYVGFVAIAAWRADWMDAVIWRGLNLAIIYGFALIVMAILLAFIYGFFCRVPDRETIQSEAMQSEGPAV